MKPGARNWRAPLHRCGRWSRNMVFRRRMYFLQAALAAHPVAPRWPPNTVTPPQARPGRGEARRPNGSRTRTGRNSSFKKVRFGGLFLWWHVNARACPQKWKAQKYRKTVLAAGAMLLAPFSFLSARRINGQVRSEERRVGKEGR